MFKKILAIVLSLSLVLGLAVVASADVAANKIEFKEKTATSYVFDIGSEVANYITNGSQWYGESELHVYDGSASGTRITNFTLTNNNTTLTINISDAPSGAIYWGVTPKMFTWYEYSGTVDLLPKGPALTADTTNNNADKDGKLANDIVITFSDAAEWRAAITSVEIKLGASGTYAAVDSSKYTVAAGTLTLSKDLFEGTGNIDTYFVKVNATDYKSNEVQQYVYPTYLKFTPSIDPEHNVIDSDLVFHLAYTEEYAGLVDAFVSSVTAFKQSTTNLTIKSIVNDANAKQVNLTVDGTAIVSAGNKSFVLETTGSKVAVRFLGQSVESNTFNAKIVTKGDIPAFYLANKDNFFYGDDIIISYPASSSEAFAQWAASNPTILAYLNSTTNFDATSIANIDVDAKTITIPASAYTGLFNAGQRTYINIYLEADGYGRTTVRATFTTGKKAPVITPQANAVVGEDAVFTFSDVPEWRNAVTSYMAYNPSWKDVTINIEEGKITIPAAQVTKEGDYWIRIDAQGYEQVSIHIGVGETYQDKNQSNYDTTTSLKVVNGETTVELSAYDLYSIMFAEGAKNYTYSVCNTWPTFEIYTRANGPTIKGIFEKAGVDVNALDGDQLVLFTAADGYKVAVKVSELLSEDRYYYPNGGLAQEGGFTGSSETAYLDAVQVPAILQLNHDNGTLRFGQADPQDQQKDSSVRYMVSTSTPGTIEILSDKAAKFDAPEISADGCEAVGTSVGFSFNKTGFVAGTYQRAAIYYTYSTNGVAPEDPIDENGKLSANAILFNYAQYKNEDGQDVYNYLTVDSTDVIVKAVVVGRDHIASDIVTYEFDHTYSDWCVDEDAHWKELTCEAHAGEIAEYGEHEWIEYVVTEPTATETGETIYTCAVCGETKTETTYMFDLGNAELNELVRQFIETVVDFVESMINDVIEAVMELIG